MLFLLLLSMAELLTVTFQVRECNNPCIGSGPYSSGFVLWVTQPDGGISGLTKWHLTRKNRPSLTSFVLLTAEFAGNNSE